MKLVFLGTGGFHPNERRQTACVLLPEIGIAFDAGTSAHRIIPRLQTSTLDLFLTHAHLDHICGLTYLLVPLIEGTISRCRVHSRPECLQAVEQHLFCPEIFPVRPKIELVPIPPEVSVGGGIIRWHPLHHPGGAIGFRFDRPGAPSLAYISDTQAHADSIAFLKDVDVLIHECTYPDHLSQWCEPTGHSHTSQVAQLAAEANVGSLILTHVDPQLIQDDPLILANAQAIFPRTVLAEDEDEFEIG